MFLGIPPGLKVVTMLPAHAVIIGDPRPFPDVQHRLRHSLKEVELKAIGIIFRKGILQIMIRMIAPFQVLQMFPFPLSTIGALPHIPLPRSSIMETVDAADLHG